LIDMVPKKMIPFGDYALVNAYVPEEPPAVQILTHAFLDDVFPSKKKLFKKYPKDGYNHWIAKRLIQYGDIGQGKTTFCRWLLAEANKRYGIENVTLYYSRSDFARLLEEDPRYPWRTPVIILFDDDCTMEKLKRETIKKFVRMRHLAFKRTGLNRGLILGIIGVHRFHAGDLIFRTKFHAFIVRDCPSNKYDYDFLKNYFDEATLDVVSEIENLRERDDQYYGWAVFKSTNWEGIVINKKPDLKKIPNWIELDVTSNVEPEITLKIEADSFEEYMVKRAEHEINADVAEALNMYLKGLSLDEVGKHFNVKFNTISDWFKPLRSKRLGYWFEDWICPLLGAEPNKDKNTPIPDCITPTGDIYSLKCYWTSNRNSVTIPIKECNPEIEEAKKRGTHFKLLFYSPIWHECHMIQVNPKKLPQRITIRKGDPKTIFDISTLPQQTNTYPPKPRKPENPPIDQPHFPPRLHHNKNRNEKRRNEKRGRGWSEGSFRVREGTADE